MINRDSLAHKIDMATGRIPVDTLICNCRVVDVFSQTMIEGPVALGDGKVIAVGHEAALHNAEKRIDAGGGIVIPGLIDAHVHIESSAVIPSQFARCVLPHGTTSVIADPHEIANVCGLEGIRYMLEASENLPLNVNIMLPSCVPATPFEKSGASLSAKDLATLINHPRVGGVGEVMDFVGVINASKDMVDKVNLAHQHDKVADGHSPGLTGQDLTAYVLSGIKTDHECSTIQEMHERIRQGMYVQIRLGSACRDLPNLIHGVTPANARRCLFCTDDREPADILHNGHINSNLRMAVELGLDPMLAITIATLNSAECYNLKGKGAVAPGYDADLVIVDNLEEFNTRHVFTSGDEVARDGKLLVDFPDFISSSVTQTVNIAPIDKADLALSVPSGEARMIQVNPGSVVTGSTSGKVKANSKGLFDPKLNPGLTKLAVVERHKATGNIGLGILANYGIVNGAVATSIAHDSHNIVVAGDNDADMIAAIRDIEAIGGGISICKNGKVLGNLPLPIGGLMSDKPAAEVAEYMHTLLGIATNELKINPEIQPIMTLVFMTLPVIPELKLTANGLFDVNSFSFVETAL
ncbi:adenine deaminase [Sansalvadorimonas sp. 2012CJ34-2]|uniref:Adenine deaminase n=1 Tax=Parendozoicomonas callyspongiae TaxID=2942213 RepID=A0ABT0PFY2_9GAMM|nr:adenine deaminase [Sansalvadorimonas sp. 2012CJ34-2]MCL6269677.1 adenine deaminase [Sansalvadorimonas sp. 2012CJ34-2]